jgi:hypothetical protein
MAAAERGLYVVGENVGDEYDAPPPAAMVEATHYKRVRRKGTDAIPGLEGKTLHDYWSWAYSDIMENVQRAIYAEFLVASALGIDEDVRIGWRSYDLRYRGKRIEVKSSAYIQSWERPKPSVITFGVAKRIRMSDRSAAYETTPAARHADIWVFALFEPKSHGTGDILDAALWRFYVISTSALEAKIGNAKSARLTTIEAITNKAFVRYEEIKAAVDRAFLS